MRKIYYIKNLVATKSSTNGRESTIGRDDCTSMTLITACVNRGDHPTNIFPRVSPIIVFTKRNELALVPGNLNQWLWRDFDSKFGVF